MDLFEACRLEAEKWKKMETLGAFRNMDQKRAEQYCRYRNACVHRYMPLYNRMSDEALLQLLHDRAEELGRNPTRREIFPAYHIFLRLRFKNWPSALRAAGLKPPKEKKKHGKCEKKKTKKNF